MPAAHGNAPVGHRALWVLMRDAFEFFLCFLVPEGVQEGYAALKRLLHSFGAGYRKVHGAELIGREVFVMLAFIACNARHDEAQQQREKEQASRHRPSLPLRRESRLGRRNRQSREVRVMERGAGASSEIYFVPRKS